MQNSLTLAVISISIIYYLDHIDIIYSKYLRRALFGLDCWMVGSVILLCLAHIMEFTIALQDILVFSAANWILGGILFFVTQKNYSENIYLSY